MWRSLLNRIALFILLVVFSCFLENPRLRGSTAETPLEQKIDRLLDDLSSDRFETREAATKALVQLEEAIPLLQKARKSTDLEVRRRVTRILWSLAEKRVPRGLTRAQVLGKEGRIVEAADRVAYWGELDKAGNSWKILTQFAEGAVASTARYSSPGYFGWKPGLFCEITEKLHPKEFVAPMIDIDAGGEELIQEEKSHIERKLAIKEGGSLLLRGEEISLKNDDPMLAPGVILHRGIIAASGDFQVNLATYSLIIAGGNVEIKGLRESIVICDGDVKLQGSESSLIIARGKLTCAGGKPPRCLVRSAGSLVLPDGKTITLKDGTSEPLDFVKFFELADVGITTEDSPRRGQPNVEGVRLKEVRKESPLASGLQAGDVVIRIEGKKTPTTEILRKVLRRSLAKGGPRINFTVRRTGKTLTVSIPVKD